MSRSRSQPLSVVIIDAIKWKRTPRHEWQLSGWTHNRIPFRLKSFELNGICSVHSPCGTNCVQFKRPISCRGKAGGLFHSLGIGFSTKRTKSKFPAYRSLSWAGDGLAWGNETQAERTQIYKIKLNWPWSNMVGCAKGRTATRSLEPRHYLYNQKFSLFENGFPPEWLNSFHMSSSPVRAQGHRERGFVGSKLSQTSPYQCSGDIGGSTMFLKTNSKSNKNRETAVKTQN